ncbi:MAG: hypothetical protein KDM81_21055 [Verrucomicrobiae bacterium]|nr:hypothetical protein [Verrucomicrobiae bacterium]MCP5524959.1 hypothetical protein [Verrucomicrobiales bacterium]
MTKPMIVKQTVMLAAAAALIGGNVVAADMAPLPLKLPIPAFMGTPTDMELGPNVEPLSDKPRAPFMAPQGVKNLAAGKKVTSSDKSPITGSLELVTDGDKEADDDSFVELHRRTQWVQVDLGQKAKIYAVVLWHAHNTYQVYHDVIVQVSDDPDFTTGVKTLYNNDFDNSSGVGIGTDKEYFEDYQGRLIDAKGAEGRYLRLYSRGSTYSALNRYTEVEVWGTPAE